MSLVQSLVDSVRKAGNDTGLTEAEADECLHRLATPEGDRLWVKIAKIVVEAKQQIGEIFRLVVDYGRSIKDSVVAGCYDYVNSHITDDNFPPTEGEQGVKRRAFILYCFDKVVESDYVIAQMAKDGRHPASVRELLAFGAENPEPQRKFPIVALKQTWADRDGNRDVAYLDGYGSRRYVGLDWCGGEWSEDCRFLAVSE